MVEQIKDVSIILPIFKGCKDLKKNISSILNQSYRNYELIIIDDGADLDTQNILNAIKARYKKVVLIKNKKNLGLPKSLNRAIKKSKFNLIFRMDADDFALKDRILEQIRFLKKNPNIDILGTGAIYRTNDEQKKIFMPRTNKNIKKSLKRFNPIIHPSVCFKKKVFKKLKGYDEKLLKCQDYDLWIRASKYFNFYNLPKPLIIYSKKKVDLRTIYYTLKVLIKNNDNEFKINLSFLIFLFLKMLLIYTFQIK